MEMLFPANLLASSERTKSKPGETTIKAWAKAMRCWADARDCAVVTSLAIQMQQREQLQVPGAHFSHLYVSDGMA